MKSTGPFLEVVPGPCDVDPELERVFGAARAMAEPELAQRERVTAALRLSLAQPSHSSVLERGTWSELAPGALSQLKPPAAPAPPLDPRAARLPLPWLLFGGLLIGALGFLLGHAQGHAAGLSEALAARAALPPAGQVSVSLPLEPRALPGPATAPEGAALPAAATSLGAVTAPPTSLGAAPALGPIAAGSGVPRRSHTPAAGKSSARRAPPVAERTSSLSFREVLEQLRRARRQLDNGQATMSLLLLAELDRGAGELLREEREATRVLALCATGQHAAARQAAALLSEQSPRSIYAMRLSSSCVGAAGGERAAGGSE